MWKIDNDMTSTL